MRHKQRGLTAITWIILLGLIGTQAVLALRIIPVYMNFGTVKSIMNNLESDPEVRGLSPREIRKRLYSRLQINGINDLQQTPKAFTFKNLTDGMQITLNYEKRGPIHGNLDFVASFEHQVVIPK